MDLGRHNRKLVDLRTAIQQERLTRDGLLPIEGPILLEEAQRSGLEIVDVFIRSGSALRGIRGTEVHRIPLSVFKTIKQTEHSQGIIATVRPPRFSSDEILSTSPALIVLLGRLQDPGNVGTILRVSEAFGATGCIALPATASFHNSKAVRASAGSVFRFPHLGGVELTDFVDAARAKKIRIVGTASTSESSIEKWDWTRPTAVLVGNEGSGLNADELRFCDTVLRIPHSRAVESLNAAIATAVILYEASKQRR